ncbi:hypothetical protein D3C80_1819700 [compost metagenome]
MHSTSRKLTPISSAKNTSASLELILPLTSGRCSVRFTWPSTLRSAQSLITQPPARVSTTPRTKITMFANEGEPLPAIHNAHSVGHSSR